MYSHEIEIRVRYGETDKMGYVYYGNYPEYYEVGRTELLRSLGFTYRELEDIGILMPIVKMNIQYFRPSFYDDKLTIKSIINEMPRSIVNFDYEIRNEEGILLNKGNTVLGFINSETRRPVRPPKVIMDCFKPFFK